MAEVTLPHQNPGSPRSAGKRKQKLALQPNYWKTKEKPLLINLLNCYKQNNSTLKRFQSLICPGRETIHLMPQNNQGNKVAQKEDEKSPENKLKDMEG